MSRLEVEGLDGLIDDFEALAALPEEVISDMLNAEADVVEEAQKAEIKLLGLVNTGQLVESIRRTGKVVAVRGEKTLHVYPQGVRSDGKRNAEIGFIHEYGAPHGKGKTGNGGIKASKWMKNANEKCVAEAVERAAEVYDTYLKSKKL